MTLILETEYAIPKAFEAKITQVRDHLLCHPLYHSVNDLTRLRSFMEAHVFAVWDFMSLLKRLQCDLTCVSFPWLPPKDASLARFINEIVIAEESDEGFAGQPASHFDLYIAAMEEVGANTQPVLAFVEGLSKGLTPEQALTEAKVPAYVASFVLRTLSVAGEAPIVAVAADFLYGREDVIPQMFTRLLGHMTDLDVPMFQYYLERHIEVDGDHHGPLAEKMLYQLVAGQEESWALALDAAISAVKARIALWDGFLASI